MQFQVSVDGVDKLASKSRVVAKIAEEELAKALYAGAKQVEGEAKKSILQGGKSGRVYRRRTVPHTASAPGEAPASDTGRLVNSVSTELETTALTATVSAGSGLVKYARALEFGTRTMAARPFLFPALEKSKSFIRERFDRALDKVIDRAAAAAMRSIGK